MYRVFPDDFRADLIVPETELAHARMAEGRRRVLEADSLDAEPDLDGLMSNADLAGDAAREVLALDERDSPGDSSS